MRPLALIITAITLCTAESSAQITTRNKELQIYVTGGVKAMAPKYFGHDVNISPYFVPTIGAGAIWRKGNFQYGGEFNYADGKKNTTKLSTIYTGIAFNFLAGYTRSLNERTRWGLQTGFGYSLYHLPVTDNEYAGPPDMNATIYHNMIFTIPVSLNLQRQYDNGTFVGIRAGYNFNVGPVEWRYIEGSMTKTYVTGNDGLFLQVIWGGLFSKSNSRL